MHEVLILHLLVINYKLIIQGQFCKVLLEQITVNKEGSETLEANTFY